MEKSRKAELKNKLEKKKQRDKSVMNKLLPFNTLNAILEVMINTVSANYKVSEAMARKLIFNAIVTDSCQKEIYSLIDWFFEDEKQTAESNFENTKE